MRCFYEVELDVAGLGVIFYSPHSVSHIQEGQDYLLNNYERPEIVESEAVAGRIAGVSLGSPGCYNLRFVEGYPSTDDIDRHEFRLRLGIKAKGGSICVRDLYDLLNWTVDCPSSQEIEIEDGFYHLTLLSSRPASGRIGDNQVILVFVKPLEAMPELKYHGVPTLCP